MGVVRWRDQRTLATETVAVTTWKKGGSSTSLLPSRWAASPSCSLCSLVCNLV